MSGRASVAAIAILNIATCLYISLILPCAFRRLAAFAQERYLYITGSDLYMVWVAMSLCGFLLAIALLMINAAGGQIIERVELCCITIYALAALACSLLGYLPALITLLIVLATLFVGKRICVLMARRTGAKK